MRDNECITMLKRGDIQGLSVLIDSYGNYVGKILYSFLGSGLSAQDLEEISSDVFFQLWKQRNNLKENESLKGYIATIAKNMGRKKLRSLKKVYPLPEDFE
ncbi:MAG: sigma factor, partial [Oscillospiraceae bacterium]